jgi:enoyl-CoA hydratase/carnithine racemase
MKGRVTIADMAPPVLERLDDVLVLDLGDTENRFHPDWVSAVNARLDEADIGLPFSEGMTALIQSRLTPRTAVEAMITGRRYGGEDAQAAGIVDATAGQDAVRDTAVRLAAPHAAKGGPVLETIKARMHADVISALRRAR